jgi:hypothetical protein
MNIGQEEYYTWKELAVVDGESAPRLLTPWTDPMKYEQPFDYLFDTQGQAFEALETYDAKVEAEQSGWVLCKITVSPVHQLHGGK